MKKLIPTLLGVLAITLPSIAQEKNRWDISKLDVSKLPAPATVSPVTFEKDMKPIFQKACVRCHGEDQAKGGLRLDSLEATLKGGKAGKMVVTGDSTKSILVLSVSQQDPRTAMPPKPRNRPGAPIPPPGSASRGPGGPNGAGLPAGSPGNPPAGAPNRPQAKPLTTEQVALVRAWIDQGAK